MKVDIYTDGSCCPTNPGPGGWAAILRTKVNGQVHEKEISGRKDQATNNEMEMLAVEEGIKAVKKPGCSITVYTDSQLVVGYMRFGWRPKVPHLAEIIGRICARVSLMGHTVQYVKLNGHSGHELNERADRLARTAAIAGGYAP